MRRIFRSMPYFLPLEPEPFARVFRERGTRRLVPKGGTLKHGGEEARVFLLEKGLCAYYAGEGFGHRPTILSIILPGGAMGDMTAVVGTRCNVHTVALADSEIFVLAPSVLQDAVFSDPSLSLLELQNITAKEESLLEGMVANFTRAPQERLLIFFKAWLLQSGVSLDEPWVTLPHFISAECIGQAVNLNRVSIAKITSAWTKEGKARRIGRSLELATSLFEGIDDWLKGEMPHF